MQGAGDQDKILYWPTALAFFWFLLSVPIPARPGDLIPGSFFTVLCPVMSAFIVVFLCVGWLYERAWRRLLSTMILPLSVILMIFLFHGEQ